VPAGHVFCPWAVAGAVTGEGLDGKVQPIFAHARIPRQRFRLK
jgi:hypothetical protein